MNKRINTLLALTALILIACFTLCACTSPKPHSGAEGTDAAETETAAEATENAGADDDPELTEAPEATEEPTEEPAEEPAPTEIPEGPLTYDPVPFDEGEYRCDMNGDGTDEVIELTSSCPNDFDVTYNVSIRSDEGAAKPVEKEDALTQNYEGYAIMLKSSNEGELPALLVCVWHDSDDPTTFVYRAKGDGSEIAVFDHWSSFVSPEVEEARPVNRGYLTLALRTELMGTTDVYGDFIVGEDGFVLMSRDYQYAANFRAISVKNDLPVTIVDEDSTYEVKVGAGNTATPISTDMKTYVYAMFSTGDFGYIYYDSDEYPYNIGGQPQDYYLDVLYCD